MVHAELIALQAMGCLSTETNSHHDDLVLEAINKLTVAVIQIQHDLKEANQERADTNQKIDQGLAQVNKKIDQVLAQVNEKIDQGLAQVNKKIDQGLTEAKKERAEIKQGQAKTQRSIYALHEIPTQITDAVRPHDEHLLRLISNVNGLESRALASVSADGGGKETIVGALLPLHGCTKLYGPFASQLYSWPVKEALNHYLLTARKRLDAELMESFVVVYIHPGCDFVLSMAVPTTHDTFRETTRKGQPVMARLSGLKAVLQDALQHAEASRKQVEAGSVLRAITRFELDAIKVVSTAGIMSVDMKMSAAFRKLNNGVSASTVKSAVVRALVADPAANDDGSLQQLAPMEQKAVLHMQQKGVVYNNDTRLQLRFAHVAQGSVRAGLSGSPLWAVDLTAKPPSVTLLGLVAAEIDLGKQVIFSDISALVPSLQAALNAINAYERNCAWDGSAVLEFNVLNMHAINGDASEQDIYNDLLQQLMAHGSCQSQRLVLSDGTAQ